MKKINKTILKEYKTMALQSFSEGQIEVDFPDENDLSQVRVFLKPNGGYYKDGKFEFAIKLPEDYPNSAPSVECKTKMFHPNINYSGRICFNILSDEWDSSLRLVDYVHSLLWLLYQPNLSSRLNGDCPQNETEFEQLVRKSIIGGTISGQHFECTLADPSILLRAAPPAAPQPIPLNPRTVSDLRAFFTALAAQQPQPALQRQTQPATPAQPPQQPQETPQPATPVQPQQEEVPQPQQPQEAQPATPQPEDVPQQPQPTEVPQPQQPQEAQPATPQPEEVPQQPQPTDAPQQPQRPQPQQLRGSGVVPAHMRWAQFILPSVRVEPPRQRAVAPARRWTTVTPPIRFVGAVRVY